MTELTPTGDRNVVVHTLRPERAVPTLAEEVRSGLTSKPYTLPPKFFYDAEGSELFDRICDTPEYYPTRTEGALVTEHAARIIATAEPDHIIELGAGTCRKTRALLRACEEQGRSAHFWPQDVCGPILEATGAALLEEFPHLAVTALVGDYHAGLGTLPAMQGRKLFVFLGGTLGNFEPDEATAFLQELAGIMSPADHLLVGVDRIKDRAILEAAYNDREGITAAFNLNVLNVLNRDLGGTIDPQGFRHEAIYNPSATQIEMYLIARRTQSAVLAGLEQPLQFAEGDRIRTEISRKFTPESLARLLAAADLEMDAHFEPENGYFSLALARPKGH